MRSRRRPDSRRQQQRASRLLGCKRELDHERRTPTVALTLRANTTTVQLDEATHEVVPDAEPTIAAIFGLPRLDEHVEHARQDLGRDADAIVAHLDRRVAV